MANSPLLASLVSSVYTITNRPDLAAETLLAIQKATLKEHAAIDYSRDLAVTSTINLDNSNGVFRYSLSQNTLGLYGVSRKIKRIREVTSPEVPAQFAFAGYWGEIDFTERAVDDIFDSYGMENTNYYFKQGNSINLVAIRQVNSVAIQYYKLPIIVPETYSSWIAEMYPYAIYEHAASDIFRAVGKTDESALFREKIKDNRLDIIRSEIGVPG